MSVWVVAVAALGWLAASASVTTGWAHMLLLWAAGLVAGYAAFEAAERTKRHLRANSVGLKSAPDGPQQPARSVPSNDAESTTLDGADAAVSGNVIAPAELGEAELTQSVTAAPPESPVAGGAATARDVEPERQLTGAGLPVVLTAEEAASLLRVPQAELVAAMRAGEAPGNNIADLWRCSADALRDWLDGGWLGRDR
jgi:hypothetical protein